MPEDQYWTDLTSAIRKGAKGDDAVLRAFARAFTADNEFPQKATLLGRFLSVAAIAYDGNARRGLTATCLLPNGNRHTVAAADIEFPRETQHARYIAAYRHWMGLTPWPAPPKPELFPSPVELAVLSVKSNAARCRPLGARQTVLLRGARLTQNIAPGHIVTVDPEKQWIYQGLPTLSGSIVSTRLAAAALGLTPLRLKQCGVWKPDEHYWGEPGEPREAWEKAIIAWGPRPAFEMEQVIPGEDKDNHFSDPIIRATEAPDIKSSEAILMALCEADLRCLDAHAHLGNIYFGHRHDIAIRHYEAGVRIGELSLPANFDGVLSWGWIDNRPFLRCLHGYGLCAWKFGRFPEAERIFERMLWLNPGDNQGVRFLLDAVRDKKHWWQCRDL